MGRGSGEEVAQSEGRQAGTTVAPRPPRVLLPPLWPRDSQATLVPALLLSSALPPTSSAPVTVPVCGSLAAPFPLRRVVGAFLPKFSTRPRLRFPGPLSPQAGHCRVRPRILFPGSVNSAAVLRATPQSGARLRALRHPPETAPSPRTGLRVPGKRGPRISLHLRHLAPPSTGSGSTLAGWLVDY